MPSITSRRVARLAVMLAVVALVSSGCGGGAKPSDTRPADTQPSGAQTNGLEARSPAEVQQAAAAALKAARSVHVTGTAVDAGKPVRLDLRIQRDASTGTLRLDGATVQITTIGGGTYLKGDQRVWKTLGAPAVVQQRLAGKWVKVDQQQVTSLEDFSLGGLAAGLTKTDSPLDPKVEQAELNGRKVVVLSQRDGSKLYVANTGPAYPLRADGKGQRPGRIDFTDYGVDFRITAPTNAVDLDKVG